MNRYPTLLCILVLLATHFGCSQAQVPAEAAPNPRKTLRLFVIGNSFSGNATRYLPQIAKDGGHEVEIGRAEIGGAPLQSHWEAVEAAEKSPDDAKGKPYGGKSLRDLLGAGNWDVVTIQQGSFVSTAIATYQPYAKNLHDYIKKLQPEARVMMHQTWAYRSDAAKFGAVRPNHLAQTQQEMWEESRAAYRTTAKELGVPLIPVGDAFWRVSSDPIWGYKKDAKFDFATPVFPHLPDQTHSLHTGYSWSKENTLALDANHANEAGCYLAGLVWYGFLFHESPEKVTFVPPQVPTEFAAFLRKAAAGTLAETSLPTVPATNTITQGNAVVKAQAQLIALTTSQGTGADTSIRGGEMATRSFGHLDILRVRNSANLINVRKTYLRFDLSALRLPVKSARSATLSLTIGTAEGASPEDKTWKFQVFGLQDGHANETWGERTTNWDNAPANDLKSTSALTDDAVALGTFTIVGKGEAGKTVTFAPPELLKFWHSDTDGKATLILTRQEVGDKSTENVVHVFASKESAALAASNLNVEF